MVWLQPSYVHFLWQPCSLQWWQFQLSCTFSIKYGPALGRSNFGRIPDLLNNARFPFLYFILNLFELSLRFDLSIIFCFFRVIVAQSALHCMVKSYPFHIQAELVKHLVFVTVLLIVSAVAAKYSNQGFSSSKSASSRSKIRNQLPGTWWMQFVIPLACGFTAAVARC